MDADFLPSQSLWNLFACLYAGSDRDRESLFHDAVYRCYFSDMDVPHGSAEKTAESFLFRMRTFRCCTGSAVLRLDQLLLDRLICCRSCNEK